MQLGLCWVILTGCILLPSAASIPGVHESTTSLSSLPEKGARSSCKAELILRDGDPFTSISSFEQKDAQASGVSGLMEYITQVPDFNKLGTCVQNMYTSGILSFMEQDATETCSANGIVSQYISCACTSESYLMARAIVHARTLPCTHETATTAISLWSRLCSMASRDVFLQISPQAFYSEYAIPRPVIETFSVTIASTSSAAAIVPGAPSTSSTASGGSISKKTTPVPTIPSTLSSFTMSSTMTSLPSSQLGPDSSSKDSPALSREATIGISIMSGIIGLSLLAAALFWRKRILRLCKGYTNRKAPGSSNRVSWAPPEWQRNARGSDSQSADPSVGLGLDSSPRNIRVKSHITSRTDPHDITSLKSESSESMAQQTAI